MWHSHLADTVCTAHPSGGESPTKTLRLAQNVKVSIRSVYLFNIEAVSVVSHFKYTVIENKINYQCFNHLSKYKMWQKMTSIIIIEIMPIWLEYSIKYIITLRNFFKNVFIQSSCWKLSLKCWNRYVGYFVKISFLNTVLWQAFFFFFTILKVKLSLEAQP